MDITPTIEEGLNVISSYGDGVFTMNKKDVYEGSILLMPERVVRLDIASLDVVSKNHLSALEEYQSDIELLLVGGGESLMRLPDDVEQFITAHQITIELMNTGAACRTYNVLLSEGRKLAALLIAV